MYVGNFDQKTSEMMHEPVMNTQQSNESFKHNYTASRSLLGLSVGTIVVEAILIITILISAFIGNTLILLAVWKNKLLRTTSSYLLVNLATVDLNLAVLIMPTILTTLLKRGWTFGWTICIAAGFIDTLLTNAQIMAILSIGVNRFIAVHYPHWYQTETNKRFSLWFVIFGWIFSIGWCMPPIFGWGSYSYIDDTLFCTIDWNQNQTYALTHLSVSYVVPAFLGLYFYVSILRVICHHVKKVSSSFRQDTEEMKRKWMFSVPAEAHDARPQTPTMVRLEMHDLPSPKPWSKIPRNSIETLNSRNNKQLSQVTKAFLVVVITFAICWIPRGIANIWATIKGRPNVPIQLEIISTILIFMISALNPIVYGACNRDFRRTIKKIIHCK